MSVHVVLRIIDISCWTKFTFPGRGDKYSAMKWNWAHFTGVDWDEKGKKKAIFKLEGEGKHFSENVDSEKGVC
jgi:alpha-amylase